MRIKMIKILIVDDDFLVRMYLKQLIDWDHDGFSLLGDAKDGKSAFKMACAEESPDIIITDICMPVMNGLELIRELKQQGHKARFIVLSCHDDFIYVKEAMQLGADEYLLKNDLDRQNLLTTLRKVSTQLTTVSDTIEVDQRIRNLARIGEEKLRQDFLFSVIEKDISEEELKVLAKKAGITTPFNKHVSLLIRINACQEGTDALTEAKQVPFQETFLQMCQSALTPDRYVGKQTAYCFSKAEDEYCILLDFSEEVSVSRAQQTLRLAVDNISKFSRLYFNVTITIGVGTMQNGIGSLKIAYLKAKYALECSFYQKEMVIFADYGIMVTHQMPEEASYFIENLGMWITEGESAKIEMQFSKVLAQIRATQVDPGAVRQWLESVDQKVGIERVDGFYQGIKKFEDIEQTKAGYLQKSEESLSKQSIEIDHPAIRQAIRYIQQNYTQPLSLADVAEVVHLNPTYFSSLFKKNMGSNFSEYLLDCRINRIKKIILLTNERLKDIAFQAGFQDYRHFCKLFKSMTGKSPSSYRNMNKSE